VSPELEMHALRKANQALSEEVLLLQNRLRISRAEVQMFRENREALNAAALRAQ
jgi:hypothetical protein